MLCYRDMTFCPFLDCTNIECSRRLTAQVHEDARKWWGDCEGYPPICKYVDKPDCFVGEKV